MKEPTPDELRKFVAKVKFFAIGGKELGLPEDVVAKTVLQAPCPYGKLLGECTPEEAQAIEDASEWKDVFAEAEKRRAADGRR